MKQWLLQSPTEFCITAAVFKFKNEQKIGNKMTLADESKPKARHDRFFFGSRIETFLGTISKLSIFANRDVSKSMATKCLHEIINKMSRGRE